jgi:hypothetical protein
MKTRSETLMELLDVEEQERRIRQTSFPWEFPAPPPSGPVTHAAERAKARALRELMLEDVLTDIHMWMDSIADDKRRPCRCLNPAACLCIASGIVREHQRGADALRKRLRNFMTPPPAANDSLPTNSQSDVDGLQ